MVRARASWACSWRLSIPGAGISSDADAGKHRGLIAVKDRIIDPSDVARAPSSPAGARSSRSPSQASYSGSRQIGDGRNFRPLATPNASGWQPKLQAGHELRAVLLFLSRMRASSRRGNPRSCITICPSTTTVDTSFRLAQ